MVPYPTLEREIAGCDIKQVEIAKALGISEKTFYNKLSGKTEFTWAEVCKVIKLFFPYMTPEDLFARAEQDSA